MGFSNNNKNLLLIILDRNSQLKLTSINDALSIFLIFAYIFTYYNKKALKSALIHFC